VARILLLCTRDPASAPTGRVMVLRTIIRACRELGHDVRPVLIGGERHGRDSGVIRCVGRPGRARLLLNLFCLALTRRRSINECLYYSPRIERELRQTIAEMSPDLVIADMVRTAQYAPGLRLPWILDLDDLLSERYRFWARSAKVNGVLGYYQRYLPAWCAVLARLFNRPLLAFESSLIRERELRLAGLADACCLVSRPEARAFSARLGRAVHAMPMGIDPPPRPAPLRDRGQCLVFTGSTLYWPNLEAVRFFSEALGPRLKQAGLPSRLDVIGAVDAAAQQAIDRRYVNFLGYVDDLEAVLRRYAVFVAPLRSGSGTKTKVVEALMHGLVVVSTPAGVAGLETEHRRHYLGWSTADELAGCLAFIAAHPAEAARIAEAGRRLAEAEFSPAQVAPRWGGLIRETLASRRRAAADPGVVNAIR
jgi:glycosyltransferase involved in cell wall biosynthesis